MPYFIDLCVDMIVPYLSLVEKPFLQYTCPSKQVDAIHFYGIMDPPPNGSIFEAILQYNLTKVDRLLHENTDVVITRPYATMDPVTRTFVESDHRMTISSKKWMNLVEMELAILLQWTEGILLLRSYKRNVAHYIGDWSSSYGDVAIQLARMYGVPHLVDQMMEDRRRYYK